MVVTKLVKNKAFHAGLPSWAALPESLISILASAAEQVGTPPLPAEQSRHPAEAGRKAGLVADLRFEERKSAGDDCMEKNPSAKRGRINIPS